MLSPLPLLLLFLSLSFLFAPCFTSLCFGRLDILLYTLTRMLTSAGLAKVHAAFFLPASHLSLFISFLFFTHKLCFVILGLVFKPSIKQPLAFLFILTSSLVWRLVRSMGWCYGIPHI